MPSSSTRSTHFERETTSLYRIIHTHLTYSDRADIAAFFAPEFASLLEIDVPTLKLAIEPSFTSEVRIVGRATLLQMAPLGVESREKKQSERLAAAGAGCAEVSDMLRRVGRAAEGVQWARWADEIWGMAREAEMAEQAWKEVGAAGVVVMN